MIYGSGNRGARWWTSLSSVRRSRARRRETSSRRARRRTRTQVSPASGGCTTRAARRVMRAANGSSCGAAIARELALRGVRVVVVERGEVGSGTTGNGGGGVILQTKKPGLHLDLGLRSARLLRAIAPTLGETGYAMNGALILLPDGDA